MQLLFNNIRHEPLYHRGGIFIKYSYIFKFKEKIVVKCTIE